LDADPAEWNAQFESAHRAIAQFFNVSDSQRLLLTPGCTTSLALAVADHAWQSGERVVCSGLEHHALHRPLQQLAAQGVELDIVPPATDGPFDLGQLEQFLAPGRVRLVAVTAVSNVTGDVLPIPEIVAASHRAGALVLVDAAQWVGWTEIDLEAGGIDLCAFGGHKGLQAPWGIGGLYVKKGVAMHSPNASCEVSPTGPKACASMPGYCDGGSVDRIALAGLHAALGWLQTQRERLAIARRQISRIQQVLEESRRLTLYGCSDAQARFPTLAFNVSGLTAADVGRQLAARGISVATGIQCAPLAHQTLMTGPSGAVRISAGPQTGDEEIEAVCDVLKEIIE
jgi:selenocysteine lyase/cysteine desulfurase